MVVLVHVAGLCMLWACVAMITLGAYSLGGPLTLSTVLSLWLGVVHAAASKWWLDYIKKTGT